MERSPHLFCSENEEETRIRCLIWMAVWYVIGELGSLAEHVAPAELNANIRLEPGKHELTAEEIAAASCTAFVNRYKAFAPSPAARTRLKAKTRTTRRPWAADVKYFVRKR